MHLLRVQLPDRPGSLGMVATAMGTNGADISAIEIVEKGQGHAVDDFMLSLPHGAMLDGLVSACHELDGVRVLWISRYPDSWGLEGDIEVLNRMVAEPARAAETLTLAAPVVFHCQWAALLDARTGTLLLGSELAPELEPATSRALGSLAEVHRTDLPQGWLPGWSETTVALAPVAGERCLVLGRTGGPAFLDSELRRLQHLCGLS